MDLFSYRYYTVIMLKEISKNTKQYLENDVVDWIIETAFQGSKVNYYDILSITGNFYYYDLFRICMYVYIYVCMHVVYIYTHTCIYIYAHIHT